MWTNVSEQPTHDMQALLKSGSVIRIGYWDSQAGCWMTQQGMCLPNEDFTPEQWRESHINDIDCIDFPATTFIIGGE